MSDEESADKECSHHWPSTFHRAAQVPLEHAMSARPSSGATKIRRPLAVIVRRRDAVLAGKLRRARLDGPGSLAHIRSPGCQPRPDEGAGVMTDTLRDGEKELVRLVTDAAEALIRGDARRYAALMRHADDYTLMSPYGGDVVRGFDESPEALDALARFFQGGEVTVEVVETYVSRDLAVLAVVERQRGTVGDLPEQDWSLRVTWVFRRDADSKWELVHRHADALVHGIDHTQLSELARGELAD